MDLGLKNKHALILAASKGLGKASALALAQEGVRVTIAARTRTDLHRTADEIRTQTGATVTALPTDVTHAAQLEALFQNAGPIDILVNNAGGPPFAPFESLSDDQWHHALELNFVSVVRATRLALPAMKQAGRGRIVNLLSLSVKSVLNNSVLSTAARLGVVGMAKLLADEVAPHGITVNNIATGIILTDRVRQMNMEHMADTIPARRLGRPDELGALVAFLASEQAAYITGATIPIDGGLNRAIL
jgi:3-oxoacyl-[acyl-carrier protein] reductase